MGISGWFPKKKYASVVVCIERGCQPGKSCPRGYLFVHFRTPELMQAALQTSHRLSRSEPHPPGGSNIGGMQEHFYCIFYFFSRKLCIFLLFFCFSPGIFQFLVAKLLPSKISAFSPKDQKFSFIFGIFFKKVFQVYLKIVTKMPPNYRFLAKMGQNGSNGIFFMSSTKQNFQKSTLGGSRAIL